MTMRATLMTPEAGLPVTDCEDRFRLEDFYARYAECIVDDRLEAWPDFFSEACVYQITPRLNYDRGLPVSIMLSESRGGLIDRVTAIRNTMVFGPRTVLLSFAGVRPTAREGAIIHARANFSVFSIQEGVATLLMIGRSFDRIDTGGADWTFVERVCVYDNDLLPATVIYPI